MQTSSFDVQGMSYVGCAGKAQRALDQLDGVSHVEVSLRSGIATVLPTLLE
jgi:copper chaperone CopZ